MGYYKKAWIILACNFFFTFKGMTSCLSEQEILAELGELQNQAISAPLNLSQFIDLYEESLQQLSLTARLDLSAEQSLERIINRLVNLLIYNLNDQGIDVLMRFGPLQCQLRLAGVYFSRKTQFTENNKPRFPHEDLETSAAIYKSVWIAAQDRIAQCQQELLHLTQGNSRGQLQLLALPPSLRADRMNTILRSLPVSLRNLIEGDNTSCLSEVEWESIHRTIEIILDDFYLSINPFLPQDLQQFAWCSCYLLNDNELCMTLYNDFIKMSRGASAIPSIETWLNEVKPDGYE